MTGTATHFTHQGIPANISRAAIVPTSFCRYFCQFTSSVLSTLSMLGARGYRAGPSQPLNSPDRTPRENRGRPSALRRREDDQNPQILGDVMELVRHPGRHIDHAAPRDL